MTVGDCFQVAIKVCESLPGSKIVHGLPVGRGPLNEGKRYWHAWVEQTVHGVALVVDKANGLDLELPASLYYRMAQLDEEHVHRFDIDEAYVEMLRREHYGPWVDDYEGMGL